MAEGRLEPSLSRLDWVLAGTGLARAGRAVALPEVLLYAQRPMKPPRRFLGRAVVPFLPALVLVSAVYPARQDPQELELLRSLQEPDRERIELTLDEALRIALDNDLQLQIQEVQAESAGYIAAGSWGAFDPVLTAEASVFDGEFEASSAFSGTNVIEESTYQFGTGVFFPLTTGGTFALTFDLTNTETNNALSQGIQIATTDVFGAEFIQPLLRGAGSTFATSLQREADLEFGLQLEVLRATRQDLFAAVEGAYWELAAALRQLEVAYTTLNLGKEQLDQNQRRLQAGVGTQVEVLQAETTVAQREEVLLLRATQAHAAGDQLKRVLYPGKNPTTWNAEIHPTTPLPEPPAQLAAEVPPWTNALAVALDNRSDLRQQRISIAMREVVLARSLSERKPALDLTLSSFSRGFDGDSEEAFEKAAGWDFPQNTARLLFSVPFGNRTRANAERSARAQLRSARLVYDQIESQAAAQVRNAVRQVIYSARAVLAADKSSELAVRQLEAEQARYREGLSTNFQVVEFQQQLAEAMYAATRARANLALAQVELKKAQGVLGETEK